MPAGVDGLARRGQRAAPGAVRDLAASGRTSSPPARTSSPPRPGTPASTTTWSCRCPAAAAELARDEGIRPDTTAETLAGLKPSFRPDGTITAGNASPLNDGASALLLGSERPPRPDRHRPARPHRRPRRVARSSRRCSASRRSRPPNTALARAGIGWSDVGAVELNEAFAVQSLACVDAWKRRPRDRQRPAAARSRSATRSAPPAAGSSAPWPQRLRARGDRWGVAAICIGVGQAPGRRARERRRRGRRA